MSAELKKTLNELSRALQKLHKDLLMLEAKGLSSESERSLNPYELLHAALNDPRLNWLRKISSLIVTIDTLVDEAENLSGIEANQITELVLNLLDKSPPIDEEFWRSYSKYLTSNPDIIMRHAQVKEITDKLKPNI